MNCQNRFCIYEKDGKCTLESIEVNISGICDSCIYPDIPDSILEYEKKKTLYNLEREWNF